MSNVGTAGTNVRSISLTEARLRVRAEVGYELLRLGPEYTGDAFARSATAVAEAAVAAAGAAIDAGIAMLIDLDVVGLDETSGDVDNPHLWDRDETSAEASSAAEEAAVAARSCRDAVHEATAVLAAVAQRHESRMGDDDDVHERAEEERRNAETARIVRKLLSQAETHALAAHKSFYNASRICAEITLTRPSTAARYAMDALEASDHASVSVLEAVEDARKANETAINILRQQAEVATETADEEAQWAFTTVADAIERATPWFGGVSGDHRRLNDLEDDVPF